MWGVNHALGLIQAFLPSGPPLRRCGCVEQMERFVSFDDNAANGRLENEQWESSLCCWVWSSLPISSVTHMQILPVSNVCLMTWSERPRGLTDRKWGKVRLSGRLRFVLKCLFSCKQPWVFLSYSLISSDLTCMTDSERDQIDQDAQIFMRTCSEAIRQLRNEGALFFYCAADFLLECSVFECCCLCSREAAGAGPD